MTTRRRIDHSFVLCAAMIIAASILARTCSAEAGEGATAHSSTKAVPSITSVSFGVGGKFKVGYWTPATVTLSYGEKPANDFMVELTVPDTDGVATRVTMDVLASSIAASDNDIDIEMFTKIGRMTGDIEVIVRDSERVLDHRSFDLSSFRPLSSDTKLVLAIGESPSFTKAIASREAKKTGAVVSVQVSDAAQLPSRWYGYDGVNMVYVSTSRPTARDIAESEVHWQPLRQWIDNGGRFVLSVDASDKDLLGNNTALGKLLPGRFDDLVTVPRMNQLEIFARANNVLQHEDELGRPLGFRVARLTDTHGRILAYEGGKPEDLPVVVRLSAGFGDVFFIGVDLESDAFVDWDGTQNLILHCFRPDAAEATESARPPGELSNLGYDDLSGQLRAALGQFDRHQVGQLPIVVFFLLAAIYIVLIGPADYFFLKRYVGKMELTWLSFPLVVLAACAGAYWLANSSKSEQVHVNQVDLIDIDQHAARYRSTSWACVFSPSTSAYDISFQSKLPNEQDTDEAGQGGEGLLSWSGVPGRAIGAMQSPAPPPQFDAAYAYENQFTAIAGLPIQVWSTKNLSVRSTGPTTARIDADLVAVSDSNSEPTLDGAITNRLGVRLSKCVLLYDRWTYLVGTIDPGQTIVINKELMNIRTVNTYLTSVGDWRIETDQQRMDPARVLSRMMFYQATGGSTFTPLANNYQSHVDFTHLLHTGKAIFLGSTDEPAVTITQNARPFADDASHHYTVYRCILSIDSE
jgi:hypothetical protein